MDFLPRVSENVVSFAFSLCRKQIVLPHKTALWCPWLVEASTALDATCVVWLMLAAGADQFCKCIFCRLHNACHPVYVGISVFLFFMVNLYALLTLILSLDRFFPLMITYEVAVVSLAIY